MHSLRLMTLCLNYFQFILVSDWNKRVQNVPIIRSFLSWKHDNKWWKSIAKVAKSLRASGRCPEPRSLPSARPRELFRELDPTCRGSSAPTTPPQVNTFVPLCLLAHGVVKISLDWVPLSKGTNNWHSPEWMSCSLALLNSEWIEKWNEFFSLTEQKKYVNLAERRFADFL